MQQKYLETFLKSSSLPAFFVTMSYLGVAYRNAERPKNIPYELFAIVVPLLFGILGIINQKIVESKNKNFTLISGALFGLMLSVVGRFGLDLPDKLFDIERNKRYKVHVYAVFLYALISRFIVTEFLIN